MKFAYIVALLALAAVATAQSNSTNDNCAVCGGAMYVDAATWCAKHSWNQACCRCVISKESGGNAHACHRNSNGSIDAGLWQINQMNWASCSGGSAPCDPSSNLNCAIKVYNWGGRTWRLWSTCSACGCCGSN